MTMNDTQRAALRDASSVLIHLGTHDAFVLSERLLDFLADDERSEAATIMRATGSVAATVIHEHRDSVTGELIEDSRVTVERPACVCAALYLGHAIHESTCPLAVELCDACHARPAGHGHFALYCEPCSELPYGVIAPVETKGE